MIVCGLQINHGSSACIFNNENIIWYNEESRLTKDKKRGGIPFLCIDQISKLNIKIDLIILTGYNHIIEEIEQCKNYLTNKKIFAKEFCFYNPHHITHAYKASVDSSFNEGRVFVIDGRGSDWYLSNGMQSYETTSIYDFNKDGLKCIYKKLYSIFPVGKEIKPLTNYNPYYNKINKKILNIGISNETKFDLDKNLDLGNFYTKASKHFGFKNDEEGKFMGYQSYGNYNESINKKIKEGVNIEKLPKDKDTARTIQICFEKRYQNLIEKFKHKNMVFTGGTALNVVNNYKVKKKFNDCNLWFDPLCSDVGNSIGAVYACFINNKKKIKHLNNIYLGSTIQIDKKLLQKEKIIDASIEDVVNIITQGEVVGLVQGKAEAGPRALGNRSLLLDPTLKNAKDTMNNIKKRELFRPFAASVLEDKAKDFFEMLDIDSSPYMMYAPEAKELAKKVIPSLVHVDNTCRIQTINKVNNLILYKILKSFKVPVLMNTSFNLAGYPIVESFNDILFTLRQSSLKYVYFPDFKKLLIKY